MTHEKVLFLSSENSPLIAWLQEQGDQVIHTAGKLSTRKVAQQEFTFLISYGYRHILRREILDLFPGKAINLHISYLPWNRGADPNFWSFVEGTPKGVTIHYLDEGVDTGDIIVQKEVVFDLEKETLATSYEKLHQSMHDLFKQNWRGIKSGECQSIKQVGIGTVHKIKDKEGLSHLLTDGWDTPVSTLVKHAS